MLLKGLFFKKEKVTTGFSHSLKPESPVGYDLVGSECIAFIHFISFIWKKCWATTTLKTVHSSSGIKIALF